MTNITAIEVSLEALANECAQHDFAFMENPWRQRHWSNEYDRRARIFTMLERLGHSSKAIEVYNTYAPAFAKRPLRSTYY
jgi:hypothetical protein